MRKFEIKETTIIVQAEIRASGTEVELISVTDDGGCVMASWNFAGKSYSQTIWDAQTTPTYEEAGAWTDETINKAITQIINL